jgi:hypothetical protein
MGRTKFSACAIVAAAASFAAFLLLPACKVNVQKEANGQDKQVDINTFAGGIHVSKKTDVSDVGLAVYPGARMREQASDGSDKSANVNLSGFGFGLKVVAVEYESADEAGKVVAFYKDEMKKYGDVIECRTSGLNVNIGWHGSKDSSDLTCAGEYGRDVELKVGKKDDQHIVAVKTEGKGSSFSLVYVRTHGKDADI